jgi:uncharacterized protein YggE
MKRHPFLLCLFLLCLLAGGMTGSAAPGQEIVPNRPLVSTVGSAEIRVVPDLADLSFQIEVRNADLNRARKDEAERATRVLTALRNAGIRESELQTSQVEIEPRYENQEGGPFGSGRPPQESTTVRFYSVSQSIACTLHDTKKTPGVTAAAIEAGVTAVQGASLRTSDLRKYRDQARAKAVQAAKEKAVALAGELGVKVGRPYTIMESPEEDGRLNSTFNSGNYQRSASPSSGGDGADSAFAPGTISISARVSVSFVLE